MTVPGFQMLLHEMTEPLLNSILVSGEMTGIISPVYVRQVVEKVKACGSLPFLTDTNTLYLGSRSNAVDHITTAILHGSDFAVTGAPIIIANGLFGKNVVQVKIKKTF